MCIRDSTRGAPWGARSLSLRSSPLSRGPSCSGASTFALRTLALRTFKYADDLNKFCLASPESTFEGFLDKLSMTDSLLVERLEGAGTGKIGQSRNSCFTSPSLAGPFVASSADWCVVETAKGL
eukprot:2292749-Pyramimonas_sp.AAC.1